jgi:hypothetical protein
VVQNVFKEGEKTDATLGTSNYLIGRISPFFEFTTNVKVPPTKNIKWVKKQSQVNCNPAENCRLLPSSILQTCQFSRTQP